MQIQTNVVIVTPDPHAALRLDAVPRAIREAGFVPDAMRIQARGTYESDAGVRFRIRGWREALRVRMDGAPPSGEVVLRADVDDSGAEVVLVPQR